MRVCHLLRSLLIILPPLAVASGCVNLDPLPDPTRLYVLNSGDANPPESPDKTCARTILLGPVSLAGYLNQPAIVERKGPHEITYQEWHLWAEPLAQAVPRTLQAFLEADLSPDCVLPYESATPDAHSIQLEVWIDRLEITTDNHASAAAHWRTLTSGGLSNSRPGSASIRVSFDPRDDRIAAGTAALEDSLRQLTTQISAHLKALGSSPLNDHQ